MSKRGVWMPNLPQDLGLSKIQPQISENEMRFVWYMRLSTCNKTFITKSHCNYFSLPQAAWMEWGFRICKLPSGWICLWNRLGVKRVELEVKGVGKGAARRSKYQNMIIKGQKRFEVKTQLIIDQIRTKAQDLYPATRFPLIIVNLKSIPCRTSRL
jgi:hypothetical protein